MGIKRILAPMFGTPTDRRTLALAGNVARACDAMVDAFLPDPSVAARPIYAAEASTPDLIRMMREEAEDIARQKTKAAQAVYEEWREKEELSEAPAGGLGARLRTSSDGTPAAVVTQARYADIVCIAADNTESDATQLVEDLLFDSGRPVLYASPKAEVGKTPIVGGRAIVGWNASAQAARAVAAALPILKRAAEVDVATTTVGGLDPAVAHALVDFLSVHGVPAQLCTLSEDEKGSDDLLFIANERAAGLLVIGAYSHSRLRQMVLGGVTRAVLAEAPIPVLMMH